MSSSLFESSSFTDVLRLLSDGQFHSGEELGELLGVSRAAVWKTLQKFGQIGIDVVSVKGKGYCIQGGLDLLDESTIQAEHQGSLSIKVFPQVDSTNSYLLRKEQPERQVCLAESQTAGRGRRGRKWISPFAQNLYVSIGWGFEGGVAALEGLSLAIGLAVIRCLHHQGLTGLSLKWPNDILYQDKKLGGILIEMRGDPAGYCLSVIGVGLNMSMSTNYSAAIGQPWISLNDIFADQAVPPIGRNQLASSLLAEMELVLSGYHLKGFSAYKDEWMSVASYLNQKVYIHSGNNAQAGIFRGVDNTGALVLAIEGVEQVFHGGEVSLRRPDASGS
jgi:BirA family biotin operon repressor/biotin-[acetyl-CoA-carboxylase] ligase